MHLLGRYYPFIASFQSFDVGLQLGWNMPSGQYLSQDHPRRLLGGNNTEIVEGFSKSELSWMFTSHLPSCVIVTFIYSLIMGYISPRTRIRILGFFKIISWAIMLFGDVTAFWYTFAKAVSGLGIPIVMSVIIYLEEITESQNRGFFLSFCDTNMNAGILTSFVLGSSLEYLTYLKIIFSVSLIFWATCFILPESPIWLKKQGLDDLAFMNLKRIRSPNHDFTSELNNIDKYLSKSVKLEKSLIKNVRNLLSNRHHLKGVILVGSLFSLQQLSGICIMTFYSIELIGENSSMGQFSMVVFTGVGCFLGSLLASFLSDRIGRRPLLLISTGGIVIALGIISFYSYLGLTFPWIPIICVFAMVFLLNIGLGPLPYVLMAEILPCHLRIWGSYCTLILLALSAFITTKSFPFLSEHIGEGSVFALYTFINMLTFTIIWNFVPETMAIPRHLMENIILKGNQNDVEEQKEKLKLVI